MSRPDEATGGYEFRAPRWGDLVRCPYCDGEAFCDYCGDEGFIFASDLPTQENEQCPHPQ